MHRILILFAALILFGCDQESPPEDTTASGTATSADAETAPGDATADTSGAADEPAAESSAEPLDQVLAAQPEEVKSRYQHRHPQQTLEFFGIEPGMTVAEVLPGGGWYSRILVPYLGAEGRLIGANYANDMWPKLGMDQATIDSMKSWPTDWPEEAKAWQGQDGAEVDAFVFGALPASMEGQADAVLVIRALHNLARFEDDGSYLTAALNDLNRVLKPGGIVGVVQHEARPDMPDEWADGSAGYLKKQFVIDRMAAVGFELVDESDINQNPQDRPTTEDVVWRLPPSYGGGDDPEVRAAVDAIGESNRMTLKFRKPE